MMMKSSSFESSKQHVFMFNLKKQHYATFKPCQEVFKSAKLLHKKVLDDSQLHNTV